MADPIKIQDAKFILEEAQDIIDSAVATITATQRTQEILQENIAITDTKIAKHDNSLVSHPDLRFQLDEVIPERISNPVITGTHSVKRGTGSTWTLKATPTSGVTLTKFIVRRDDDKSTDVTITSNNTASWKDTFSDLDMNRLVTFYITAYGVETGTNEEVRSRTVKYMITAATYAPLNVDQLAVTYPQRVTAGKSYSSKITGLSEAEATFDHFELVSDDPRVTFSPSTGVAETASSNLVVGSTANGPGIVTYSIYAVDTNGLKSCREYTTELNVLPRIEAISHTIPTHLNANSNIRVRVSGATDPDGSADDITVGISSSLSTITFSKSSGIKLNEDFNIAVGAVAGNTAYKLTLTFTDKDGGTSTKVISSTINMPPSTDGFVCTKPALFALNKATNISFRGITDSDGKAIKYNITSGWKEITFSKKTNIAEGENVSVTFSSSATRGKDYDINITGTDSEGGISEPVTVSLRTNRLPTPVVTGVFPTLTVPGKKYSLSFKTAQDADKTNIKYTVTSSASGIVLTGASNIAAGTTFSMTAPPTSSVARGATYTLTVTGNDGLESASTTVSVKQNSLPAVASGTTCPKSINGGEKNKVTFKISGGGADPDKSSTTFNIESITSGLHITPTTKLTTASTITLYSDLVQADTVRTFNVVAVDALGEKGPALKVSVTVLPNYYLNAPSITSPKAGAIVPHTGFTITWTALSVGTER